MKKDSLKRIILDNQDRIDQHRMYDRELVIDFTSIRKLQKAIIIAGPRRAGKTFFLFQIIREIGLPKEEVVLLDFSEIVLADFDAKHFDLLLLAYRELYPDNSPTFFLDEIQVVDQFERGIQYLLNKGHQVFATGSSASLFSGDIASTLRGKALTFKLYPLSFSEFLRFRNFHITDNPTTEQLGRLNAMLQEYLNWGGFPEVVLAPDETIKKGLLSAYIDSMIFRDIIERHSLRNPHILERFFIKLVLSFTKQFSVSKIFNELKSQGYRISKDTLHLYLQYFAESLYFFTLSNYLSGITSPKKVYAVDNGIYTYVKRFDRDIGKLLENRIFLDLQGSHHRIYFARTPDWEVDFLTDEIAYQTCAHLSDNNLQREQKGLREVVTRVGSRQCGIIVLESSVEKTVPDYGVLPYWRWARGERR